MNIITRIRHLSELPTFRIMLALSAAHCLNDLLQSVITAVYPMLKTDLSLDFGQIGLITLVYQIASSVFQPVVGYAFDRRPFIGSLPAGMCCTGAGIALFAYASSLTMVLCAVFLVGIGSSTLHPEASRITSLASGGRRGLGQSIFQVGGNFGGAVGPLLVAMIVAPHDRHYVLWFMIAVMLCFCVMRPICRWYSRYLRQTSNSSRNASIPVAPPLPLRSTIFAITILMLLIFSKYIYMASINSYYTFYLIQKFGVSVQMSQIFLFVFLAATAAGTLVGGPLGDRYGRKPIIWISILGTAPFSLAMPHVGLVPTVILSFCAGFMLSSAFPAILLYSQELLPNKLGLVSGLFFGFSFGVAGIASAILGHFADSIGIEAIYNICAYTPLLGMITYFLPNINKYHTAQ